jgi:hypothetical protein
MPELTRRTWLIAITVAAIAATIASIVAWSRSDDHADDPWLTYITISQALPDQGDANEGGPCRFTVEAGAELVILDEDGARIDDYTPTEGRTEHHGQTGLWTCDVQVASVLHSSPPFTVSLPDGSQQTIEARDDQLSFVAVTWPGTATATAASASPVASPAP